MTKSLSSASTGDDTPVVNNKGRKGGNTASIDDVDVAVASGRYPVEVSYTSSRPSNISTDSLTRFSNANQHKPDQQVVQMSLDSDSCPFTPLNTSSYRVASRNGRDLEAQDDRPVSSSTSSEKSSSSYNIEDTVKMSRKSRNHAVSVKSRNAAVSVKIFEDESVDGSPRRNSGDPNSKPPNAVMVFLRNYAKSLQLLRFVDYFFTVETSYFWRRSLAWSHMNGQILKSCITQKYNSISVISSLILAGQIAVFFSPAPICETMRTTLKSPSFDEVQDRRIYCWGFSLLVGIFLSLVTIFTTFSAWGMMAAVQDCNAHAVLRSSIGLYATQLPLIFFVLSFFNFMLWLCLFFEIILGQVVGIVSVTVLLLLHFHIIITYSIFGRVILHSNSMSTIAIFGDKKEEEKLKPHELFEKLLIMAKRNRNIDVTVQYRRHKRINRIKSATESNQYNSLTALVQQIEEREEEQTQLKELKKKVARTAALVASPGNGLFNRRGRSSSNDLVERNMNMRDSW